MAFKIKRVQYFYARVHDQPGEAYTLLSALAEEGVNLLAVTAIPIGPVHTQLTLFPEDALQMRDVAGKSGLVLDGPHHAFLIQGDDELGVLARIHEQLAESGVNVYASSGVSSGEKGKFGYIIHVRPKEFEQAATALGV